jgi:hypothetical protein
MSRIMRLGLAGAALALCLAPPARAGEDDSQPAGPPAKIYLLSIADTKAKTNSGMFLIGQNSMTALFRANVPDAQLRIIELRGDRVGREKILAEIRGLGDKGLAAGRDILVIYYHGHGGYDLQAADHVMCTSDGWIRFYHDIAPAANQVHPRATLIFSDACAVLLVGQRLEKVPAAVLSGGGGADKLPPLVVPPVPPLFESLFFDLPPGVTAISAAMKGQTDTGFADTSGFFTFTLCGTIKSHLGQRLSWDDLLRMVNTQIKRFHADFTRQVAYIVGSDGGADPPPRFGVIAQETELGRKWHGVEVTQLLNGYPHQSMHRHGDDQNYALVAGRDVIQWVNGQPVTNFVEFVNAVAASRTRMRLTVYNSKSGETNKYEVMLRND